jgi:hypothetical protein
MGIQILGALQKLDSRHSRHALVAQEQRHRLLARFQDLQRIQRRLPARSAHHPVLGPVLTTQILHNCFQNADIVVYRQ